MASSVSAAPLTIKLLLCNSTKTSEVSPRNSLKVGSFGWQKNGFPSLNSSRFRFTCAAKPETVEKVCEIVRKQLAVPADKEVTSDSKFADLGADSLDTVEIVMGLEEEFDISVEEENSQNIATVQDAADLIDQLVQKKAAPAPTA